MSQKLDLISAPAVPAPHLLKDEGQALLLPQNVWFVGTANHDETTKDFADKTYDRAHVMELPRHREEFDLTKCRERSPISLHALQNAFEDAYDKHQPKADEAYKFLERQLAEILSRHFRISWGNRLERQLNYYIPVVIAGGGSIGEAVDHIVATKLIRKLRDRHSNRPEDVQLLHRQLREGLSALDPGWVSRTSPDDVRSLVMLREELRRLGAQVDE
jgi:hypothetical protein